VQHLGTILVNNQLHVLFQCIYLFHFSTCFKQLSAHHQENRIVSIHHLVYITLCRWLPGMPVRTGIPDSHLYRLIHTRFCIDTIDSPDDEHWIARNMERSEINTLKKCVKLVINKNSLTVWRYLSSVCGPHGMYYLNVAHSRDTKELQFAISW
jgi:hypothetical protein